MKAIRIQKPGEREVLSYVEVPDPVPGPDEVLVGIEYSGVNFVDVYMRKGLYPTPIPFTLGKEAAGKIVGVGARVADFRVGDRVAYEGVTGTHAERAAVPADRLVAIPAEVSTRDAAALMLQGLTAHYLATSTFPLQAGQTCLVHAAAGGVGLLLCQIAKIRGARVIGTVSTEEKARLARAAGADEVIFYTKQDFAVETKRLTSNRGVDVVYDSVGRTTFDQSLNCLARRGVMALFGLSSGPVPPVDPQLLSKKGSLYLTRPTLADYDTTREELTDRARELFGWLREGRLSVRIDRELPLKDVQEAYRALEERETAGKILLRP